MYTMRYTCLSLSSPTATTRRLICCCKRRYLVFMSEQCVPVFQFQTHSSLTCPRHSLYKKPQALILTGSEALSFLALTVRSGAVPSPRTAASRGLQHSQPSASQGEKGKVGPFHVAVPCPCSSPLVQNLHTRTHTECTHITNSIMGITAFPL